MTRVIVNISFIFALVAALALCFSARADERRRPEQIAKEIQIERCHFIEATLQEALEYLSRKAQEKLGSERPFSLNYIGRTPPPDTRITFALWDMPLLELLQVISLQTGLELGATDDALYLYRKAELPLRAQPVRPLELSWSSRAMKVIGGLIRATAERDAFTEAHKVLEQSFGGDRFHAPKEAKAALDRLQKRIDECQKRISEFNRLLQESQSEAKPTNE